MHRGLRPSNLGLNVVVEIVFFVYQLVLFVEGKHRAPVHRVSLRQFELPQGGVNLVGCQFFNKLVFAIPDEKVVDMQLLERVRCRKPEVVATREQELFDLGVKF